MLIAGLYDSHGRVVLVTMAATEDFNKVHHRMPFMLSENEVDLWIDPEISVGEAVKATLDQSHPKWALKCHRVPVTVNKLKNKGRVNQMTLDEYRDHMGTSGGGIMSFFGKSSNHLILSID